MTTAIEVPSSPMVPEPPSPPDGGESRYLIQDIGWEGYLKLLDAFVDCGPRMAYLNGTVEQVTTGFRHERFKKILGRMIEYVIIELGIPVYALGSATFQRQGVGRGVEPDECYYLANVDRLDDEDKIDLEVVPPPDLVIEVEISSPLLDKLAIYAGLGVPELWRYDGRDLTLLLLQPDGSYTMSSRSKAFPFLPMDAFARHLQDYTPKQESRWALTYRTWVREVVAPLHQP